MKLMQGTEETDVMLQEAVTLSLQLSEVSTTTSSTTLLLNEEKKQAAACVDITNQGVELRFGAGTGTQAESFVAVLTQFIALLKERGIVYALPTQYLSFFDGGPQVQVIQISTNATALSRTETMLSTPNDAFCHVASSMGIPLHEVVFKTQVASTEGKLPDVNTLQIALNKALSAPQPENTVTVEEKTTSATTDTPPVTGHFQAMVGEKKPETSSHVGAITQYRKPQTPQDYILQEIGHKTGQDTSPCITALNHFATSATTLKQQISNTLECLAIMEMKKRVHDRGADDIIKGCKAEFPNTAETYSQPRTFAPPQPQRSVG